MWKCGRDGEHVTVSGILLLAGIFAMAVLTQVGCRQVDRRRVVLRLAVPAGVSIGGGQRFKQINRRLTLMWGLVFGAMVPSHVIAGTIDTQLANVIFNWVVPMALIVWAVKRSRQLAAAARKDNPAGGGAGPAENLTRDPGRGGLPALPALPRIRAGPARGP